jgi:hypothetical protein
MLLRIAYFKSGSNRLPGNGKSKKFFRQFDVHGAGVTAFSNVVIRGRKDRPLLGIAYFFKS